MGLDIIAISKIVKGDGGIRVGADSVFNRVEIEPGEYDKSEDSEEHSFRAGPYSYYNRFRETLSMSMHGIMPVQIWEGSRTNSAFIEMIDFSDCEGCIGAEVSNKLYHDFANNRHKFKEYIDSQGWEEEKIVDYLEVYEDFMKAFEIAGRGGIVIFH
jgi:hypothetical protein